MKNFRTITSALGAFCSNKFEEWLVMRASDIEEFLGQLLPER